jgi:hypothetical protein
VSEQSTLVWAMYAVTGQRPDGTTEVQARRAANVLVFPDESLRLYDDKGGLVAMYARGCWAKLERTTSE